MGCRVPCVSYAWLHVAWKACRQGATSCPNKCHQAKCSLGQKPTLTSGEDRTEPQSSSCGYKCDHRHREELSASLQR